MADTGWLSPGTCSDTGTSWANPSNASALDGSSTTAVITGWLVSSGSVLLLSNFGASIPAGMAITKVEISSTGSQTLSSGITTTNYGDVVPTKTISTAPSASNTANINTTFGATVDISTATLDGAVITTWTPADFNSSSFGFRIQAPTTSDNAFTGGTVTTSIDQFLVRITYAAPTYNVGPNNPSTSATSGGTTSWATPANANVSDDVYTTHTTSTTAANMPYLNSTGLGFAIPIGSTINGITAIVEKKRTGGSTGNVRDDTVQLLKAGSRVGTNKAVTATNWGTTDTNSSYGGSADLWGTTWTAAEVNSSNFGVSFRTVGNGTGANRVANVDNIRVTVNYTPPSTDTDPYLANVVSLLHFNGSGTSITDDYLGNTWSVTGGATQSTTSPKFGSASLDLSSTSSGTPAYVISTSNLSNYVFGTSDFTIEGFVKWNKASSDAYAMLFDFRDTGGSIGLGYVFYVDNSNGSLNFYAQEPSTSSTDQNLGVSIPDDGAWHYVAVSRVGNSLKGYVDGTGGAAVSFTRNMNYQAAQVVLGYRYFNSSGWLNGYFDEWRVTKGVGRYSGTYIPVPTNECRRRSKSEPPCRPNIEPGVGAGLQRAGGG